MRWVLFLIVLLLSGCLHLPEPVWTEVPTAEQLIAKLAAESGRFSSLDGAASVAITNDDKFFSSQQFLLLEKPNRMRADVLTGFGQLILQMTTDGETLAVFLNTTVPGRFLRGPASYENISRFVKIPLMLEELLALLLYDPPLAVTQHSRVEVTPKFLKLVLSQKNRHQELLFDRQLRLVGGRYFEAGEKYLSVDYQKFTKDVNFPQKIIIEMPLEKTRIKVKFSELKMNQVIVGTQFNLEKPAKILVEYLP